ncbi:Heme A synthase [Candidatus Terasakiella magnetica]|uniref:Heme A synthase n=1 Tax=Candidatus Terasakiella magnetica TaxID=1867952 RepID=A0A1C3RC56_9PROT|nr:COX15/CtaA family protein [Candidatus Terasakiella magnetica]SCA54866.1 Heme A synthase [Candidatus Terasakiella magnetica]
MRLKRERIIGLWLFGVAMMVFFMVVLGGLTRLTGSGLSMVDWKPVTGWLPPLSLEEWQRVFELYKQSPQYEKVNFGMSLEEFRNIFWLEFLHRLWGRIIGLAFGLPLVFFILRGWVSKQMILPLCGLFVLGGAQGVLGWYMVKSGLVDIPEVSQYRLAAHLGFAFVLYAALIWTGLKFYKGKGSLSGLVCSKKSLLLLGLSYVTIFAGALVAGLDAGLTYNTFPLMDGELIPTGLYDQGPWYLNHFENITTVQFQHRVLAIALLVLSIVFYLKNKEIPIVKICALVVCLQAVIGIATLLMVVPISLASLHQAGGLLVFTAFTWLNFEVRS